MSDEAVVNVRHLTRRFRRTTALDNVSLDVPRGCVFGLLGENGAGKSTLIKHLLGALRAKQGTVRVFGMDPIRDVEKVLARIGYLSEDREMPTWMRIDELMAYTKAFYPNWDQQFAEEILRTFRLDRRAKIKTLSRGERAQAGLLAALAHRPELLVLDEPSSGLDAIVRRDILGAIVRTVADEGRTVFFSSHLLEEVERVADYVAMIVDGKITLCDKLDHIKDSHHTLVVRLPDSGRNGFDRIEGVLRCEGTGDERTLTCEGDPDRVTAAVREQQGQVVEHYTPSLEDIFIAHAGRSSFAFSEVPEDEA